YARILSSELVGDRPRPVGTSVIDDGDLQVVGKTGQHGQRFFDDRPDVVFFVECWEEEGEAVELCGHWRPRLEYSERMTVADRAAASWIVVIAAPIAVCGGL